MSGEQDGMFTAKRFNELPDFDNLGRVKANSWLIQDNNFGIVDERLGQTQTLAVAAGNILNQPFSNRS